VTPNNLGFIKESKDAMIENIHFLLHYFTVVLVIERKALCMLGKCSTNWAMPLAF
jgi:hypothetical protein